MTKEIPMRSISRSDRPQSSYQRKFTISLHALERFRERVDEEFRHRNDNDLGNLLDEKMRHPQQQYTVRDPRAPEDITQLLEIVMRQTGMFYVVVRHATAITVLDPDMAKRNFADTWKTTLNTPFNNESLKQVMRDVQTAPAPALKLTAVDKTMLGHVGPAPCAEIVLPLHSTAPEFSPLELAGFTYARAMRHCREKEQALERAKREVAKLEVETQEAAAARDAAHAALTALVEEPS